MTSFWQYNFFVDIRRHFSENCRQTGVEWLKWGDLTSSPVCKTVPQSTKYTYDSCRCRVIHIHHNVV